MKKFTKAAALLLAVLMALSCFAGCSKSKTEEKTDEFVYQPTYFDLSDFGENSSVQQVTSIGEKVYMLVSMPTGETVEETYTDENGVEQTYSYEKSACFLYEVDAATGEKKKLEGFVDNFSNVNLGIDESGVMHSASVYGMIPTADGKLAVVRSEETTTYNIPANFNPETDSYWQYDNSTKLDLYIDVLDETGAAANTISVMSKEYKETESYFSLRSAVCGSDGNWYINTTDGISIYSADGSQLLFDIPDNNINSVVRMADGRMAVIGWNDGGNLCVKVVDTAKKNFTDEKILSIVGLYFNETFTGNSEYDLFGYDSTGIVGVDAKSGNATRVLNWLDSDLSPDNVQHVAALENGDFILYNRDWSNDSNDLIRLVKTKNDPSNEKKIITLATFYIDSELRSLVSDFNKSSSEYRIKVTDYSEYNTGDDYTAGITKLNTEITAGNVPDIIANGGSFPITQYAAKGILEDLTPYIERDLGKDALVEDFFKTLRDDNGKLYELYSSFNMQTFVGLRSVVGDESDWSFKAMQEALAKLPEGADIFGPYYSRSSALYTFLYSNMDKFVDWETGKCSFDNQDFIDLLETVKTFPADEDINYDNDGGYESDSTRVLSGKQLLAPAAAWSLTDFRANTFYAFGKNADISFVGYPGTGSTFSASGVGYSISASSANKDAAWQFISRIVSEDYQKEQNKYGYYNGMPTNKAAFDDMMTKDLTPDFDTGAGTSYAVGTEGTAGSSADFEPYYTGATNEKGEHEIPKTTYGFGDITIDVYAMTDAEKEVILDLLKNTTTFMRYDTSLSEIINEEIQPFFQGQKTAEDAAKMIQSRATIYINEQR